MRANPTVFRKLVSFLDQFQKVPIKDAPLPTSIPNLLLLTESEHIITSVFPPLKYSD